MGRLTDELERVDVRVVTLGSRSTGAEQRSVRRVPQRSLAGRHGTIARLNAAAVAEALRFRPDVVLSGHINVSPAALAVRRTLRVPYVQYLYGREVVTRPRLTAAGVRGAAAVIAISSHTAELAARNGSRPGTVHLIPPGVDLSPAGEPERQAPPTVVSIGRLEERYKGVDVLIRALPLVRSRLADTRLVLVGDGPMKAIYANLARSLGLDGSVEFAGSIDDESRDRLLDGAHVFAMTSRLPLDGGGEGFGIVYLEAAVHGLPAVAGNVGGAVDAVVHRETGLLVDPTDHVAVADALVELLANPEAACALGRAAANRAEDFAWPRIARQVEDLLLEVAR
jgi:phosphatidyl-myo-inositol dimannoside synthase